MTRVLVVIVMSAAMFVSAKANAADTITQPAMSKRQMIAQVANCMRKRMSASKLISFNEAARACKDQLNNRGINSATGTLVAADSPGLDIK